MTGLEIAGTAAGEFAFTRGDFRFLADVVRDETGIVLAEGKAALVYSRLSRRLRGLGLTSFADYCALVARDDGEERQALIAAMTTNVTSFFREPHHFDHLRGHVLPGLIARARAGERVRLWSAACSSGEEAWSLALTVLAAMPDAGDHDILILASDIDAQMLARARAGRYGARHLAAIPPGLRSHVRPGGEGFTFADPVRALLRFGYVNLAKDWPVTKPFDVIFCRNVMIYFDAAGQGQVWHRFAALLPPGGHLYIGHSERIAMAEFALAAQTVYRRTEK